MVFSWLTSWLANWRSCDPESAPPRLELMEKPCPSDTAVLESCGEGLLWQAACFTHVICFRPCVKSFDQWVYREKKKRTIPFCVSYWGVKDTVSSRACRTLVQKCTWHWQQSCVWWASVEAARLRLQEALLSLTRVSSEGKQRQSHYNFDVTRYSFIHLHLWHLETPLGSSPAFSFVLKYLMVRIGKHHPGKALFLFLPLATSLMNLRIVGFWSV